MIFTRMKPICTVLVAFGFTTLAACITPGSERIVGPDGSPMLHVHCGADQSECFRLAGESCPFGYDYAPVYDPKDGNFFVRSADFEWYINAQCLRYLHCDALPDILLESRELYSQVINAGR